MRNARYEGALADVDLGGRPVALVVCGGSGTSRALLAQWSKDFGLE
jgi:hypothetical protein